MSDPSSDTYVSKAPAILVTVVLECVFPIAHCRRCMNMFEHAVAVTVTAPASESVGSRIGMWLLSIYSFHSGADRLIDSVWTLSFWTGTLPQWTPSLATCFVAAQGKNMKTQYAFWAYHGTLHKFLHLYSLIHSLPGSENLYFHHQTNRCEFLSTVLWE